jgi:predicted neuraminidase
MHTHRPVLIAALVIGICYCAARAQNTSKTSKHPAILSSEFLYDRAEFPSCHASTIVETPSGLVAAFFGGTDEGNKDVGIWLCRHEGERWSAPVEVANGKSDDGQQYPSWNPVLFQMPDGPLVLFYKVGPSPSKWWGMRIESKDGGKTWSKPVRLGAKAPAGGDAAPGTLILGPIRAKPVLLADGTLLCGSSTEHAGWRVQMERTKDLGDTATVTAPPEQRFDAIQPTILGWPGDRIQILCRSRQKRIVESWSRDGGKTWDELKPTELPNPSAGIDAVMLKDGRALLVYNDTPTGRTPLSVAVSKDGRQWTKVLDLETDRGEYSYPAVIQTQDGKVHVTYTWRRQKIRHAVLDQTKLVPREAGE